MTLTVLNEPFCFVNVVASCISAWWLKADKYKGIDDNPSKLHWRKSLSLGFKGLISRAMKIILDTQKFWGKKLYYKRFRAFKEAIPCKTHLECGQEEWRKRKTFTLDRAGSGENSEPANSSRRVESRPNLKMLAMVMHTGLSWQALMTTKDQSLCHVSLTSPCAKREFHCGYPTML